MLRRRSLKSRSDLRHRKSASSSSAPGVVLEHHDPALAQRDAHIAAWEAYARAEELRAACDMALFPPSPESSPRRRQPGRSATSQGDHGADDEEDLRRRQSVRFMGPCSVPPRSRTTYTDRGCTRRSDVPLADARDGAETDRSQTNVLEQNDVHSSARPPSPPRRTPPAAPLPKIAASYLDALAAAEEYYTPEDDIASAPSSYRRIHRSRSMLAAPQDSRRSLDKSGRSLGIRTLKSSDLSASASRRFFRSEPAEGERAHEMPRLRAPKSMSFLSHRNRRPESTADRDADGPDFWPTGLPDLPEDGDAGTGRKALRSRYISSTLFSSRSRRIDPRMRQSLRSSSSSTDDPRVASSKPLPCPEEQMTFRLRARKASTSLKIKLKSFFTASKSGGDATSIPSQHIEAQRSHANNSTNPTDSDTAPDSDRELIRSPPAKIPSVRLVSSGLVVHSRKASVESLKTGDEQQRDRLVSDGGSSSLTSWVHSGPSTLTSQEQRQWREWERQRLSVIRENGAHAPSTSMLRRPLGSGLFQPPPPAPPEKSVDEKKKPVAAAGRPLVDSQRIYSALVKRMHALGIRQTEERAGVVEPGFSMLPGEDPDRAASNTPDTIRRVKPERQSLGDADSVGTPSGASKRSRPSRERISWDNQGNPPETTPTRRSGQERRFGGLFNSGASASDGVASQRNEGEGRSTAGSRSGDPFAEENTQPDWHSSPASHLFRSASPYRRALRKSMKEERNAWAQQSSASEHDSDAGTQVRHASALLRLPRRESDSAKDLDYTESIYSSPSSSSGGGEYLASRVNRQARVIETPAAYRTTASGGRDVSAASSIDWKTWLSANIGKFDPSAPATSSSEATDAPSFPSEQRFSSVRRHVREQAQIDGDDDDHPYHHNYGDHDSNIDDIFATPTRRKQNIPLPPPPNPFLPPPTTSNTYHDTPTPLSQLEPNVVKPLPPTPLRISNSAATKRPTPSAVPSTGTTAGGGGVVTREENESPTRLPVPPPVPPRSKLRPEPLRVVRLSGGQGVGMGMGRFQGQGGRGYSAGAGAGASNHTLLAGSGAEYRAGAGTGAGVVASGAMSVLSSPGLSEAVMRQFGPPVSFYSSSSSVADGEEDGDDGEDENDGGGGRRRRKNDNSGNHGNGGDRVGYGKSEQSVVESWRAGIAEVMEGSGARKVVGVSVGVGLAGRRDESFAFI